MHNYGGGGGGGTLLYVQLNKVSFKIILMKVFSIHFALTGEESNNVLYQFILSRFHL